MQCCKIFLGKSVCCDSSTVIFSWLRSFPALHPVCAQEVSWAFLLEPPGTSQICVPRMLEWQMCANAFSSLLLCFFGLSKDGVSTSDFPTQTWWFRLWTAMIAFPAKLALGMCISLHPPHPIKMRSFLWNWCNVGVHGTTRQRQVNKLETRNVTTKATEYCSHCDLSSQSGGVIVIWKD